MMRTGYRALLLITSAGLLSTTPAIGVAAEASNGAIRVENGRLDIGDVKAGAEGVATFVLHNEGDGEIKVLHAKPS